MKYIEDINENNRLCFELYYLDLVPFQEKELYSVKEVIAQSRLSEYMNFTSLANLYFSEDDTKHKYPHIELHEVFSRKKINAVIYDLRYTIKNNGIYDKLIIYKSWGQKNSYYGYLLYNSKTYDCSHRFLLDQLPDSIPQSLEIDFSKIYNFDLFTYYINKVKKNSKEILNISDYNKIIELYNQRYIYSNNGKLISEVFNNDKNIEIYDKYA